MFVHPVIGEDPGLIRVLEGKLARLTQRVPTLWIEHIPTAMQEFVVGVPPVWLRLFKRVVKAVLVYMYISIVLKFIKKFKKMIKIKNCLPSSPHAPPGGRTRSGSPRKSMLAYGNFSSASSCRSHQT